MRISCVCIENNSQQKRQFIEQCLISPGCGHPTQIGNNRKQKKSSYCLKFSQSAQDICILKWVTFALFFHSIHVSIHSMVWFVKFLVSFSSYTLITRSCWIIIFDWISMPLLLLVLFYDFRKGSRTWHNDSDSDVNKLPSNDHNIN